MYEFARAAHPGTIPRPLLRILGRDTARRASGANTELAAGAVAVESLAGFRELCERHEGRVTALLGEGREITRKYAAANGIAGAQGKDVRYQVYKRYGVWRDAIASVRKGAQSWDEADRNLLWDQLIRANRCQWYAVEPMDTFHQDDIE